MLTYGFLSQQKLSYAETESFDDLTDEDLVRRAVEESMQVRVPAVTRRECI